MFLVFDRHNPARYRVNTLYVYLECQLDVLWLQLREDCNGLHEQHYCTYQETVDYLDRITRRHRHERYLRARHKIACRLDPKISCVWTVGHSKKNYFYLFLTLRKISQLFILSGLFLRKTQRLFL